MMTMFFVHVRFARHPQGIWCLSSCCCSCACCGPSCCCVCLFYLPACSLWSHAMASAIASNQKKQATLLVYQFVVCFVRFVCSISYFQPPGIYNSSGDRAIGLNIYSTRCFVQHFNEKAKLRIVSLIFSNTTRNARGFGL